MRTGLRVGLRRTAAIAVIAAIAIALPAHAGIKRVLLAGDSWAGFLWKDRIIAQVFATTGLGLFEEEGALTAIGGTTASVWKEPGMLALIDASLALHPTIDTIHLSLGGNDLLWLYHTGMSPAERNALFDAVQADIAAVVDHCLALRPDLRVLICDYDYLNLLESLVTFNGSPSWPTVAMWWKLGLPAPAQINDAFAEMGKRKLAIAQARAPRVAYVQNFGLNHFAMGYATIGLAPGLAPFPGSAATDYWPFPGGYPGYPNTPAAMNSGGAALDPIHLNVPGYRALILNCIQQYYFDWMWNPYVPDLTPPQIASIAPLDPTPTNAAAVRFAVAFDEPVTGVDAADFLVEAPGLAGAAIEHVSGSGASYIVRAATGSGEGSLGIAAIDDDSIADRSGNRFGGPGAGNGGASSNGGYHIDHVPPAFAIASDAPDPAPLNPFGVRIDATEPVYGFGVSDVDTVNCGAGAFAGHGAAYAFELIGFEPGAVRVSIPAGAAYDAVGNASLASDEFVRTYTGADLDEPTALYASDGADGDLRLAEGVLDIDTGALAMSGSYTAAGRNTYGVCVFDFGSVDVGAGVIVNVHGPRPLALAAQGDLRWGAAIDASGAVAGRLGGGIGGAGGAGAAGGAGGTGGNGGTGGGIGASGAGGAGIPTSDGSPGGGGASGGPGAASNAAASGTAGRSGEAGSRGYGQRAGQGAHGAGGAGGAGATPVDGGDGGAGGGGGGGGAAGTGGSGSPGGPGTVGAAGVPGVAGATGHAGEAGAPGGHAEHTVEAASLAVAAGSGGGGGGGGGGAGGGSGGGGGGGAGGGGGGGGGGGAFGYTIDWTFLYGGLGGQGGLGQPGSAGGEGGEGGLGGQGGQGGNGGGAIVFAARGMVEFLNGATVDVSAGAPPVDETAGAAGLAGAAGSAPGGNPHQYRTDGLPGQPFLLWSGGRGGNGAPGGAGGNGGQGGHGGAGGSGGQGGLGTPGMVKVAGSVVLGKKLGVKCRDHRDAPAAAPYRGRFTWITGMAPGFRAKVAPTFDGPVEEGAVSGDKLLFASSPFAADLKVPLIPTLDGGADTAGFVAEGYWNESAIEDALPKDPAPVEVLRMQDTPYESLDQIAVYVQPGAPAPKQAALGGGKAAGAVIPLGAGRSTAKAADGVSVWTTFVPKTSGFNTAPVFDALPDRAAAFEGRALVLPVAALDADGDGVTIDFEGRLPAGHGAALHPTGPGRAEFRWTPAPGQAGVYAVTFHAFDDSKVYALGDTASTLIEVGVPNLPPIIVPVDSIAAYPGAPVEFDVAARDPEGGPVDIAIAGHTLPGTGPTLEAVEPGTSRFAWMPGPEDAGSSYTVDIRAAEAAGPDPLHTTLRATIAVAAPNRAPVFEPMPPIAAAPGAPFAVTVHASDPDGDRVAIGPGEAEGALEAEVIDLGGGAAHIAGAAPAAAGIYHVAVAAVDDVPYPAAGKTGLELTIVVGDAGPEGDAFEGDPEGAGEGGPEGGGEGQPGGVHSADLDGDGGIGLSELLAAIQLYNSAAGYACAAAGAPEPYLPFAAGGDRTCPPHQTDYAPQDWRIGLGELLRLIQFYNAGGYRPCAGSEDGFCPGIA